MYILYINTNLNIFDYTVFKYVIILDLKRNELHLLTLFFYYLHLIFYKII